MATIMDRRTSLAGLIALLTLAWTGCATQDPNAGFYDDMRHYQDVLAQTSFEDVSAEAISPHAATPPPQALRQNPEQVEYWPLSLQQAIRTALINASVMNDLGGTVIQSPEALDTLQDPSIRETDPRFGVQAALSAFDAQFQFNGNFEKNNRPLNNRFAAGTHDLQQDLHEWEAALVKRAATGTEFSLRHITDYDANNANGNLFPSFWDTYVEGEFRHPLLQGGGLEFNRIAGPDGVPGAINGVVIARLNSDISLADLEIGLRNLVSNVENAYWDLYFAYRDLDAKRQARDASLEMWRKLAGDDRKELPGAEADKVAQAREQYFRFEAEVQNARTGRLLEGTRAENDTSGGTFRANGGVYVAERRLRLIMGLPVNDIRLIRPSEEPMLAKVIFDWDDVTSEALGRRVELRRQRLAVQRRELELIANRNFLKPRLDAVGAYRWRGMGKQLINSNYGQPQFDNAWGNLMTGDYQEWQLGFEFSVPLGFRQAHAAVRNGELAVAREKAILNEQERQVLHDLSNAVNDLDRAYEVAQLNLNRVNAAKDRLAALKANEENVIMVNLALDAQQRLAKAESDFFQSLVEYALAIKNVHVEKGTWKEYHNLFLAEELSQGQQYACNSCGPAQGVIEQGTPADSEGEEPVDGPPPTPQPASLTPPPVIDPVAQALEQAEAAIAARQRPQAATIQPAGFMGTAAEPTQLQPVHTMPVQVAPFEAIDDPGRGLIEALPTAPVESLQPPLPPVEVHLTAPPLSGGQTYRGGESLAAPIPPWEMAPVQQAPSDQPAGQWPFSAGPPAFPQTAIESALSG